MKSNVVENRILLYMDLLGTKKDANKIQKILNFFSQSSGSYRFNSNYNPVIGATEIDIYPEISHFSDNIAISYPLSIEQKSGCISEDKFSIFITHIINIAAELHKVALEKQLLFRGAITTGLLFHKGNIIFGDALNCAAAIESKTAIYPRIIVDEITVRRIEETTKLELEQLKLEQDFDGMYFLNYFKHHCFVGPEQSYMSPYKRSLGLYKKF